MAHDPVDTEQDAGQVRLVSLAQLARGAAWRLELAHDRAEALLIWITRGQGIALIDGKRRGVGIHNAMFIPARHLMALDLGRQGHGQAVVLPEGHALSVPGGPLHLRVRDVDAIGEMTNLIEAMAREQGTARPLRHSALSAHAELALIWLRRQALIADHAAAGDAAAQRLVRAYCARLVSHHMTGMGMVDHAAALGVTATHLSRVCRAETGRTAAQLLCDRLIHAARTSLSHGDASVQVIANRLGFSSPGYFSRFVLRHTGQTPTALRGTG